MLELREYNTLPGNKQNFKMLFDADRTRHLVSLLLILNISGGNLEEGKKKDVKERPVNWAGLLIIGLIVLLGLAGCSGDSDLTETKPEKKGPDYCEIMSEVRKIAGEAIARGELIHVPKEITAHVFRIDPVIWRNLTYEQKENLVKALNAYGVCDLNKYAVVYLEDLYSGKRLGKSLGKMGAKIYK